MKATLTINDRGVVTLPAKLRQAMGLRAEDQLIAEMTPEGLLLRPAVTLAVEIYSPEREREFDQSEAELGALFNKNTKRKRIAAKSTKPARKQKR
jgi:AbrB family looped-hinge helix DNA binding protein